MKKLAIKGHPTRGKEVIELLEMMGGKNIHKLLGSDRYAYCVIEGCQNEIRVGEYIFGDEDMCLFTLEEFLEKYPFKVGDKVVYTKYEDNCDDHPVTIKSMKWTGTIIEYTFDGCVTCLAKDLKMWEEESKEVISGIHLNSCDYAAGYRSLSGDSLICDGSNGYYWSASSTPTSRNNAYSLDFHHAYITLAGDYSRGYGYSVCCVKRK